jgi:hypothetical protein
MDYVAFIIDKVFHPIFYAICCFLAFAGVFAIGLAINQPLVMFGAVGFLIAGISISFLFIIDRWAHPVRQNTQVEPVKPPSAPILPANLSFGRKKEETPTQKEEKTNGNTKSRNKIQAVIECG